MKYIILFFNYFILFIFAIPNVYAYFDDFSTDTTGDYSTYYWEDTSRNTSGSNTSQINYDSLNERIISQANGGYGRIFVKTNDNSLVDSNTDFEFSFDFETLAEYSSGIYFGELSSYWDNTHIHFRSEKYIKHAVHYQVTYDGTLLYQKDEFISSGGEGNLKLSRIDGVYAFYMNNNLFWEDSFDELEGLDLHYGFMHAVTSGPSGWTAKSAIDNWDYSENVSAPVPEPTTMLLFGTGILGLLGFGRKKKFMKCL